jgi:hypothetical protein
MNMAKRRPVTARGGELLALLASAGEAGLMLTQAEGLDAVNAGHAVVDTSVTEGDTAKVTLTEAGRAALTSDAGGSASGSKFEIKSGFVAPENTTRRGRTSTYPFEQLEVGQYFDVAPNAGETQDACIARLQSSVAGARARFATDSGTTKAVTIREYQKDENGKFVKDADGKRIPVEGSERVENRPVMTVNRDFKVISNPDGPGARVGRIK